MELNQANEKVLEAEKKAAKLEAQLEAAKAQLQKKKREKESRKNLLRFRHRHCVSPRRPLPRLERKW
jgi:multidrug resistance efflux pump